MSDNKPKMKPFNIQVLDVYSARVKNLREIKSQAIYEGATAQLHPEGIFSTTIFGKVGTKERSGIFGKIELDLKIIDPTVFEYLMQLKGLYGEIIAETKYARFDNELMDFVQADATNGDTGYDFFFKHWKKIKFQRNKSARRSMFIDLIEKYRDIADINRVVVMPAGLRDIEINDQGRLEENEVNEYYRRVLAYSRLLSDNDTNDLRLMNKPRRFLQMAVQDLWSYLANLFGGKGGFFYEKTAARRVFDGTRNVITAMDTVRASIGDGRGININQLTVGAFQTSKGCRPLTIGILRNVMLSNGVFVDEVTNTTAQLIDPKTLERVSVQVPYSVKDRWLTLDGLGRFIENYREVSQRIKPIDIEGHYLALVYESNGVAKLFWDIKDLPEGFDKESVRAATQTDLYVHFCVKEWERRYTIPARYPIAGQGSVFPASFKVVTTVPDKTVTILNDNWEADSPVIEVQSYPDYSGTFYDSMSMHPATLKKAAADHDGDTSSANYLLANESIAEMEAIFKSAKFYLSPGGGFKQSMSYWTLDLITHNMNL